MQQSISNLYKVYKERKHLYQSIKVQIQNICPILIKGSIEEAQKTDEA